MTLDATAELLNSSSGIAAVPSQSQCQKQPAMTIKLVGDDCVNKVTLIILCDGDGDGDGDVTVTVTAVTGYTTSTRFFYGKGKSRKAGLIRSQRQANLAGQTRNKVCGGSLWLR